MISISYFDNTTASIDGAGASERKTRLWRKWSTCTTMWTMVERIGFFLSTPKGNEWLFFCSLSIRTLIAWLEYEVLSRG